MNLIGGAWERRDRNIPCISDAAVDILAMKKSVAPIPFAGSQLGETRHVCAFFNSDDEAYRVLLPFIKAGFECGDKAVHVVNPDNRCDHVQRLAAAGIDLTAAQQSGQFELRSNTETYLRDGRFDQDRMLEVFEQLASGNARDRFRSAALSAIWTGRLKAGRTSTISLSSNLG
jgi:hypothetical protein